MKTKKTSATSKAKSSAAKPAAKPKAGSVSKSTSKLKAAARSAIEKIRSVVRKKPAPSKSRSKVSVEIPPILFEGDQPAAPSVSGPGEKFALGPTSPARHFAEATELPSSYGTGKLFIAARDPHWLYAHWDFNPEQQRKHNAKSIDRHLILRIYADKPEGKPVSEVHVHPESNHWFVHVERAGTRYAAEIGYYATGRRWTSLAVSGATLTPPDSASGDTSFATATIPVEVPFKRLLALVKEAARANAPLAEAIEELRAAGHPGLPAKINRVAEWTPAQERALAEIIAVDQLRRVWMGSLEITELIRGQLERELASIGVTAFSLPSSLELVSSAVTSPSGGPPPGEKGFWFNVNAELIIYGATEPDATVTIGGRRIKLRADGSFSYRFSLPDGKYDLPVVAVSADGTDGRAADLKFSRATEILGDVGVHPQDPSLKPPTPDNV